MRFTATLSYKYASDEASQVNCEAYLSFCESNFTSGPFYSEQITYCMQYCYNKLYKHSGDVLATTVFFLTFNEFFLKICKQAYPIKDILRKTHFLVFLFFFFNKKRRYSIQYFTIFSILEEL
jgi:hypothetical protein